MDTTVKVVFRVYDDGEVIALFPELSDKDGNTKGYSHKAAWFFVEYRKLMRVTRPAKQKEYIDLFHEIRGKGFAGLMVYKRARIKTKQIVQQ